MPEGDTLRKTATTLAQILVGREVTSARGRVGGPDLRRVVGSRVERVESVGKHLLVGFSSGLTLHTHLGMRGSWHRYRAHEPWRRGSAQAVAVLEVPGAVAVCFSAPTVELLETRALRLHPVLRALGPDLIEREADLDESLRRLRAPQRERLSIAEALLDQRAQAGLGNVYRSEVLYIERVDPFAPLAALADATLTRLLETGSRLLRANAGAPLRATMPDALGSPPGVGEPAPRRAGDRLWVYGRAGRPCRKCGTPIRARVLGELPRRVYWCPRCQPPSAFGSGHDPTAPAGSVGRRGS